MKKISVLLTVLACTALLITAALAQDKGPRVKLTTSRGEIVIELHPDKAPLSSANFLAYVNSGGYDGTVFHRVINNFMIQGGGMDEKLYPKPSLAPIRNEADNGLKNEPYTVAMARTGDPHSATNQFFINVADNKFLNHKAKTADGWGYAVFGKVVAGKDVVDRIKTSVTASKGPYDDVPVKPVVILKAEEMK